AALAAVTIYVFLRQNGAKPALKRAAPGVKVELGNTLVTGGRFAQLHAVELGIDGISEFAAARVVAGNAERSLVQQFPVASEEFGPRRFVTRVAGARQRQRVELHAV